MKTIVTITDITRMAPPFVCVAGVTEKNQSIRIQFRESRIDEDWLCNNGVATVRPFARVGFVLLSQRSEPPHTEDWIVDKHQLEDHGQLKPTEKNNFLSSICDPSVDAIFGTEILHDPGFFVLKGKGNRSLGTIRVQHLQSVSLQCYDNSWDYRLSFVDASGKHYSLKIKDLTFCGYLDYYREKKNQPCEEISSSLTRQLREADLYLRIGLARGWANYPDRCFLQVTGVYSFPDYLEGRCFTDFITPRSYRAVRPIYQSLDPKEFHVNEMQEVYAASQSPDPEIVAAQETQLPSLEFSLMTQDWSIDDCPPEPPVLSEKQWQVLCGASSSKNVLEPTAQRSKDIEATSQSPVKPESQGWLAKIRKFLKESGSK